MKKSIIVAVALGLCGVGFAQVNPDQKEQQRARQELTKEQERQATELKREQEKELERMQKEQKKEAQREQKALKEKQQKELRRQERRAEMGRPMLSVLIDPYYGSLFHTNLFQRTDVYHSASFLHGFRDDLAVGGNLLLSVPVSKRWDVNFGGGYRFTRLAYTNSIEYIDGDFAFLGQTNPLTTRCNAVMHSVEVPLLLARAPKQEGFSAYFGVVLGYNFKTSFVRKQLTMDNEWDRSVSFSNLSNFNKMRLDVTLGLAKKSAVFRNGFEIYFNLLPSYTDTPNGRTSIHEFGFFYHL
ncbi:MAG: outer membrane beta-barrel protein [Bacteroidales bacterium]|nr:outer membrane beta-barrel protein [Bacteroidales bacterium]